MLDWYPEHHLTSCKYPEGIFINWANLTIPENTTEKDNAYNEKKKKKGHSFKTTANSGNTGFLQVNAKTVAVLYNTALKVHWKAPLPLFLFFLLLVFAVLLVNKQFSYVFCSNYCNAQQSKTSVDDMPDKHASTLYLQRATGEFE